MSMTASLDQQGAPDPDRPEISLSTDVQTLRRLTGCARAFQYRNELSELKDADWTEAILDPCNNANSLSCFQQD